MTDAARSYEQSDPTRNTQFWRGWSHEQATGPDTPAGSTFVWHADAIAARQDAARRARPAWVEAERQWRGLVRK